MGIRISATFNSSIDMMSRAYAGENGISFSEAVEILTGSAATKWWMKHDIKERKALEKKYKPVKTI
jgi:3-hydroxyisobutyrate dehydrogenase-like beta-hydroxyacid dehydrogenase